MRILESLPIILFTIPNAFSIEYYTSKKDLYISLFFFASSKLYQESSPYMLLRMT